jgi:hypothetical protein
MKIVEVGGEDYSETCSKWSLVKTISMAVR